MDKSLKQWKLGPEGQVDEEAINVILGKVCLFL